MMSFGLGLVEDGEDDVWGGRWKVDTASGVDGWDVMRCGAAEGAHRLPCEAEA